MGKFDGGWFNSELHHLENYCHIKSQAYTFLIRKNFNGIFVRSLLAFFDSQNWYTNDLVLVSMQAHPFADNPYYWQFHENMVSLLNVPLFESDGSTGHTFSLLLSGPCINPFSNIAKTLEGQATLKSAGWVKNIHITVNYMQKALKKFTDMIGFICSLWSSICFSGSAFYNKWWHNCFILHYVGKRPQIMWTSQVGLLMLEEDFNSLECFECLLIKNLFNSPSFLPPLPHVKGQFLQFVGEHKRKHCNKIELN